MNGSFDSQSGIRTLFNRTNALVVHAVFLFLFALTTSSAQSDAFAQGGYITEANLSFVQHFERWHVFWGSENPASSNTTISVSDEAATNMSNETRYIEFPGTHEYYVLSDSPVPFSSSNYSAPTYEQLDAHFSLYGYDSFSTLFENTSVFRIYTDSSGNYTDISLPTLYLSGTDSEGNSYPDAFRQGVALLGSEIVFIVPKSDYYGADGSPIDFQFALPYELSSSNVFYLFSVSEPAPEPEPESLESGFVPMGMMSTPVVSFTWEYDGTHLTIYTEPYAQITIRDELGATYSGTASSSGVFSIEAPPGFRYFITVTADGYSKSDTTIYVPMPTIVTEEGETDSVPLEGEPDALILEDSESGTVFCIGSDCYQSESDGFDSTQALTDLSCTGTICRFVGISEADFIEKYRLKKVPISPPSRPADTQRVFDFGQFFERVGQEVSSGLGSPTVFAERERSLFLYAFTFFAVAAVFIYAFKSKGAKFSGGYD